MPSVAKKLVVVQNNEPPPVEDSRPEELRLLEALLFAAGEPLDEATLARQLPNGVDVKNTLARLKAEYASRGVNLVRIGKKWTFRTADDLSWLLTKQTVETRKLSRAAVETLAIVAYHQPVTRAEIEEIRQVGVSKGTIDLLMELQWIKLGRRRQTPGRPVTFVTTDKFLEQFGLENVKDLPRLEELRQAGLLDSRPPLGYSPNSDGAYDEGFDQDAEDEDDDDDRDQEDLLM